METFISKSSEELAKRLSIESVTSSTIEDFNKETKSCTKRIQDTTELTTKIQKENDIINDNLQLLKEKDEELQSIFKQIDQLEIIVNTVKSTYNAVAENLDQMEKSISASTPFRFGKSDTPVQPYFPPPNPVEIYDTNELFKQ